jgi:type I restriction enzyme S subunit
MTKKVINNSPVSKKKNGGLPIGWGLAQVKDVCDIIRGVSYKKADSIQEAQKGYLPILRATNIQDNSLVLDKDLVYVPSKQVSENQRLKIGDIVIATSSGSKHLVGKTAQVKEKWYGAFGAFCAAIRSTVEIDCRYLGYFFNSPAYKDVIAAKAIGVNINNLRRGDIEKLKIPLAPLNEQKRIVAEIEKQFSRLDEAVDNLKRVKANLKRYKASVLKAAVEGKLTEEWREKHPDVEPADKLLERILAERRKKWEKAELAKMRARGKEPKDDKWKKKYKEPAKPELDGLPSLPDGWAWTTVIQLSFVVSGQTPKGIANEPISGDIPWFKVGDMNTNGNERLMNKAEMYLTEKRAKKLGLNIQPAGTIIFPKRGGAIATNKKRILSNPSGYDLNTMGIYPIVVHHTYFWQWFLSINLERLADGSNVPQINHGDIEPLHVPLPPFVEQIQISEVVERSMSLADGLLFIVYVNLKRADRLRQSILKKAFSGKLVAQDETDEFLVSSLK